MIYFFIYEFICLYFKMNLYILRNLLFFYLKNDKVSEKFRKFRQFYNLEKLSNTLSIQVI